MKIGDLVSLKMKHTQPPQVPRHGVIVKTWKNHYRKLVQIEILWEEGNISQLRPDLFEVINEGR
jgi:hypothetical protein